MSEDTIDSPRLRFHPVQPRNASFWVLAPAVAVGLLIFVQRIASDAQYYGKALVVSSVYFTFYGALFWWFTQRIDRYSSIPWRLVITGFAWGGFAATFLMGERANLAVLEIYMKLFGQAWVARWGPALTAPFTEEIAKGVGLLLLVGLGGRFVRTAFDGFILGAFIGLGFQILEDIAYMSEAFGSAFGADPLQNGMQTLVVRSASGFTAHILYSSVFCAGLTYLIGRSREPRRVGRGLLLMFLPMLAHGLWDGGLLALFTILDLPAVFGALTFPIVIGGSVMLVVFTFRVTVANERFQTHRVLEPEVAAGVLSADLASAVTGTRRDRKHYVSTGDGHHGRRVRKLEVEKAFDLVNELDRAGGRSTDRVEHARREVARVRSG